MCGFDAKLAFYPLDKRPTSNRNRFRLALPLEPMKPLECPATDLRIFNVLN
jgi:hypothetical protein